MSELKHQENGTANGYQGGGPTTRAVTPGGHPLDSTQPAFPVYHRKCEWPRETSIRRGSQIAQAKRCMLTDLRPQSPILPPWV